jgi:hypothetical protein
MPMYDETSPYDTHWPRPGPVMVLVAALAGLIGGIVLGLAVGAFSGPSSRANASPPTTAPAVSTTLPDRFYIVQIASVQTSLPRPDARVTQLRAQHITADVLKSSDFNGLRNGFWVIYSGVFTTRPDAEAHRQELLSAHPQELRHSFVNGPITRQ